MTTTTARFQPIIVLTFRERDALKRALNEAMSNYPEEAHLLYGALNQLEDMI
jgi:hypothetical protein